MKLIAELDNLADAFAAELAGVASAAEAESLRNVRLGRKGDLAALMNRLPELPAEERPAFGKAANAVKERLNRLLEDRLAAFRAEAEDASLSRFDPTLPGRMPERGSLHPITLVMEEICGILNNLGFETVYGPEVETDFHNFGALNFPDDHPARDMQDTLFIAEGIVMRTHTSPMQVRAMLERKKPPVAVIAPGKVYRRDYDLTHSPMFHQIEGLLVDENISLAHLRGVLTHFLREFFGADVKLRFRPSFFPFTEPSVEVDMSCLICRGSGRREDGKGGEDGCRVCKGTGWLEILGAGMVDPAVFAAVGFDPACAGFAFGLGVERVAMLKYGIDDLRMFFENDLRFLGQFVK
ncbi:MAG: phenylalanine--tRNA ligase subunit alpha [Desulfovibrio sp.]|jgi:phenylalanyl-tRNA synthetase alpha chain|nr:phenylalanine--tRNA ligase subunit alpha [Desulfovibrio sp.]